MTVVNFKPYLESICEKYAQWWDTYTFTDVVGKKRDEQKKRCSVGAATRSPLLHNLIVERVKPEKENRGEQEEKTERLTVLEGLRKYARDHVLLIGRPGSGKSTALVRLLLESAQKAQAVIAREAQGKSEKIPVLVELRYYHTSILDLIRDFLKRHQILLESCQIEQLLFQGQFLLLLDGVNELPSEAARGDLQKFHQDYRSTIPMVFTTRDLWVGGDLKIEKKLQMQPLTKEQMREFVCGYLPEQGEEMLKQLSGRLRELGETPLLLWMLCSVFVDNQNQVPANLGSVFRRFTQIYDNKLKQDIPVSDESRRWWKRLLQHLAWVMTHGGTSPLTPLVQGGTSPLTPLLQGGTSPLTPLLQGGTSPLTPLLVGEGNNSGLKTEILVAIPKQQARDILTQFLKQQDYHQPRDAEVWLDDLLKHHLIQVGAENKIEFRHQLLQEYYAAERLLQVLPNLSDEQLQWDYLNYLKWTEPVALMMQLVDKQSQAVHLVKLALVVDWRLGARLAGKVKPEWQEETVKLIADLNLPQLLGIRLLKISQSSAAVPGLIQFLEDEDSSVRSRAASALGKIKSKKAVPWLIKLLEDEDSYVRYTAASALGKIKSNAAVPWLIKLLEDEYSYVRSRAASALGKIKSNEAVSWLIKLLEDEDSYVRYTAASALGKIKSDAAVPWLIKLREDEYSYVRDTAASALKKIKSDVIVPGLIQLLENEDSDVRDTAASALGKIKSDAAVPGLIKLLQDEDSSVRDTAASALGKIKSDAAVPWLIKLLQDEDSYVRNTAASALGKIKSNAAVPWLIKLLEDEDSSMRYTAAEALGKIKSNAAVPWLIKLLEDEYSYVRFRAAEALGKIKSNEAVSWLIKLLEDEDSYVRSRAASALGKIKSKKAVPWLIKLLEDEYFYVRSRAASALGKIKSNAAVPWLIKLLEDEYFYVRSRAASALGKIKSNEAVSWLIKLLEDEDSYVRYTAASALGKIKSDAAVPWLIKLLEDEYSYVRYTAAEALEKIKSDVIVPGLIQLLENEDSDVRDTAAEELGKIKSDAAVPGLIKLLQDEDSSVRDTAASALGKIKSNAAVPGLIKLLEDEYSYVRDTAASALGKIKSKKAVPGLIKLLEDEYFYVRDTAASALGKIKSKKAVPWLIKLLEDEDSDVRDTAVSALVKIKSDAAVPWLIKLLQDEDSDVRYTAAEALGEIKSDAAVPWLIKLLQDEDSDVRYTAAEALGEIKSDAAVPGLIKLLQDEDSDVRDSAAEALGEIKSDAAVRELIQLLEDEDSDVRDSAAEALGEIKSDAAVTGLIQLLNTKHFLNLNNGQNASQAIDALEENQEHLKYYKPIPKPTMSKSTSHNYALLIGVGECEETKLSLPVTVKDIQALKSLLTDSNLCGYIDDRQHIRLLHDANATKTKILEALNWLKHQAENDPEATILVFYSGHGFLHQSGDYYLIPHDTDRTDIPNTALPANTFKQTLREIPAKKLLVIIDSCHAQGMATSKDDTGKTKRSPIPKGFTQTALPKTIIEDLKQGTGRVVFTSSTEEQSSWVRRDDTMSIYTYHFLEALQGAGNQPGDKVVKVSHLMNYLSKSVPATTQQEYQAEQIPCFDLSTEGDFPVALLRGGKGLPQQGWEEVKGEAQEKIRTISVQVTHSDVGNIISITAERIDVGGISSSKGGN